MARSVGSPVPGSWLHLPRHTARLRLTLLYAGTFLLLGTGVVVVTYLLTSRGATIQEVRRSAGGAPSAARVVIRIPFKSSKAAGTAAADGLASVLPGEIARQHSEDTKRLLEVSWLVLALTTVVAAVLGWFASGRVLRPLRQMTATARTISAGNLSERLALAGPEDEFKQLGDTLDDLLDRLEASFEAQRRFVANASHELRTPLTLERTLLQVALADPDASASKLRATCEELLTAGAEQERLIEALLTLASSERGIDHRQMVELDELAGRVVRTPRPEIEGGVVQLASELEPARMSGDPALIERLVANLVDNAVRYNVAGGRVDVRTGTAGGAAVLVVTNTGPVVAAGELERLFEPFRRLRGSRAAGADGHHGLGLSIVRAIVTAHGATLTAVPLVGGGLAVTVTFLTSDDVGAGAKPAT
jgi:signal transduction histidine kinase